VLVAAGRVEEDEGGVGSVLQIGCCIGADHGGGREAEEGEVVAGQCAELFLPLHVNGLAEEGSEEGEIYPEAAGEVDEEGGGCRDKSRPTGTANAWREGRRLAGIRGGGGLTGGGRRLAGIRGGGGHEGSYEAGFVAGGSLAGTLFQGEMGREEKTIDGSPGGKLATGGLPALNLLKSKREVNTGSVPTAKSQHPDIIVGMLAHVFLGSFIHVLSGASSLLSGASFMCFRDSAHLLSTFFLFLMKGPLAGFFTRRPFRV
jgi:hypothetical protein